MYSPRPATASQKAVRVLSRSWGVEAVGPGVQGVGELLHILKAHHDAEGLAPGDLGHLAGGVKFHAPHAGVDDAVDDVQVPLDLPDLLLADLKGAVDLLHQGLALGRKVLGLEQLRRELGLIYFIQGPQLLGQLLVVHLGHLTMGVKKFMKKGKMAYASQFTWKDAFRQGAGYKKTAGPWTGGRKIKKQGGTSGRE